LKIWTVASCIPDERDPCIPHVFLTEVAALAHLDEVMRAEWEINAPTHDETDEPMAYPGDWATAHELIADNDPDESWGKWTLDVHEVADPVRDAAPDMLTSLKLLLVQARSVLDTLSERGLEDVPEWVAAADAAEAIIAKAEGRANG